MKIIKTSNKNIDKVVDIAVKVLSAGGLVVYPTETCYGIGADATNQQAIDKLLAYKKRREGKPLSVLVSDEKMAEEYVTLNQSAKNIFKIFLPGPVTVVSKAKKNKLASGVLSELENLGIRISSHELPMKMVRVFGKPITASSANASYKKKPYKIDDLLPLLSESQKEKIDLIVDWGELPKKEASTVIDTTLVGGMILRKGDLDLGVKTINFNSKSERETKDLAKRLCLKHWNKLRKNGLVFLLIGDLGAGKTIFSKGVGEFLQIKDIITSPSYTLINEYDWKKHEVEGKFFHMDPWRLRDFEEFEKLRFEEMIGENNLIAIEWGNKYKKEIMEIVERVGGEIVTVGFEEVSEEKRRIKVF
jgi:L-threonylcarbamoyladenylate synthase